MKRAQCCLVVAVLLSVAGCSSQKLQTQYYTESQFSKLTHCFGLSGTVMYVAQEKLKQRPSAELLEHYEARPNARQNIAIVNKVYAEHFNSAMDYTLRAFDQCARHVAGVPEARVGLASDCAQQTLIADVAYAFKKYSYPRKEVYRQFMYLKARMMQKIVDRVYDGHQNREKMKIDIWNACMARVQHE